MVHILDQISARLDMEPADASGSTVMFRYLAVSAVYQHPDSSRRRLICSLSPACILPKARFASDGQGLQTLGIILVRGFAGRASLTASWTIESLTSTLPVLRCTRPRAAGTTSRRGCWCGYFRRGRRWCSCCSRGQRRTIRPTNMKSDAPLVDEGAELEPAVPVPVPLPASDTVMAHEPLPPPRPSEETIWYEAELSGLWVWPCA